MPSKTKTAAPFDLCNQLDPSFFLLDRFYKRSLEKKQRNTPYLPSVSRALFIHLTKLKIAVSLSDLLVRPYYKYFLKRNWIKSTM